jgi:Fe2+ or Zn2+ uptake regulation protein
MLPMPSLEETTARLEHVGHRVTSPRRAVLDAIAARPGPFTVEDLCEVLPGVGRATVFRTVKLLQELDVVCRLPLEDGGVRYELSRGGHHHHLICSECGLVSDFSDAEIDTLIEANARTAGFQLAGHSLELYGRCRACQAATP